MLFKLIACLSIMNIITLKSQTMNRNMNKLLGNVVALYGSNTVTVSSQIRLKNHPLIIKCPPNLKCDILCMDSPMRPLTKGSMMSSSCGGATIVAGNVLETKIVCLTNGCVKTVMQLSSKVTTVECIGPNACTGAKILCGTQTMNKFLYFPVPKRTRFEKCIVTCTDGGCAGDNAYFRNQQLQQHNNYNYNYNTGNHGWTFDKFGNPVYNPPTTTTTRMIKKKQTVTTQGYLPGTEVYCAGAIDLCILKGNSQVQGFSYGPNSKNHIGSLNQAKLICDVAAGGICNAECSDARGIYFCNNFSYVCKAPHASQCRCSDYCNQNPGQCAFPHSRILNDCSKLTFPTTTTTTTTTAKTTTTPI